MQIDTTNILFICGGAFAGLERIVYHRTNAASIGFGAEMKQQIVMVMDALDGILDEALAAQNEVEFSQVLAKALSLPEQLGLDLGG